MTTTTEIESGATEVSPLARRVAETRKLSLTLVEPLMLVLMAVVVAVMLLAFYLPLFEAISVIQTRGA